MKLSSLPARTFTVRISRGWLLCFLLPLLSAAHNCPGLVADSRTSSRGNFSSPAWPAPYPPDAVCHYRLQGVEWEGVKITFHHFDLEPPYTAGCLSDYLELATVDIHGTRTFRGRFCGGTLPPPILLLHPTLELVFRSNHAGHHDGFFASYEFIDEAYVTPPRVNGTSPCGGVVSGIGGVIESPGFPIGYSAGLDCLWLIRVPYSHAIYVRIQQLEFQGSIANCAKAQLGIYDGYEHTLDGGEALNKYCGDLRYYKGEEERVMLSSRNRLLIRFQTREPSKPVLTPASAAALSLNVGFRLIWSDVEFNTPENCSKQSRFACTEARFCFTKNHMGGASNCPDLRHYCISTELVCDNVPHCGETNPSDELNCYREGVLLFVILLPLGLLVLSLCLCFLYYKRTRTIQSPQKNYSGSAAVGQPGKPTQNCWKTKSPTMQGNYNKDSFRVLDLAPIARLPISLQQQDLESPGASDIMSPASGFSDSESETGQSFTHPSFCPAHGPIGPVGLLRLRPFPLLPVLQEGSCYGSETYDENGSVYSESQNSEDLAQVMYEKQMLEQPKSQAVNEWRLRQLQRSDAVYLSDDAKSSVASSPSRVCPRCLEKESLESRRTRLSKESSRESAMAQFDSGIDSIETVKNVSFDTVTSTESHIRWGTSNQNASIQTDLSGETSSLADDSLCTTITVTTFGVKDEPGPKTPKSKATDV